MPELNKTILKNNANLKAYYRFESGALTTDSSGNGYTLTNVNTAADGTGVYGGAVDLGSSNSTKYLYVASDFGITGGANTVSIWVKNNSEIASAAWKFWTQGDAGTFVDFQLAYEYNSGTRRLQFRRIRRGTSTQEFAYNLTMGTSNWYHIVQTYDGTTVRGYVNGAYVGSVASSGNGASNTVDGFTVGADGSDQSGGTLSAYCSSIFDDVAIFDIALSADQIKELYEGRYLGELRPNQFGTTVGLWHLNGNSTDFSGNNNHGTDTAITYSQANGKFGQGASFNGSSSRITKATNLGITSTTPVTMSMWVNLNAEIGSGIWCFAELMNAAASGTSQKIYYEYNSGTRRLTFSRQGSAAVTASYTIALGTTNWYHLAYVWTGGVFTGYLNGNPVATGNENGSATFTGYSAQFNLGVLNTVDNTWFANTKIDEVMVSSTALTANQIRQIYALGVGKYY